MGNKRKKTLPKSIRTEEYPLLMKEAKKDKEFYLSCKLGYEAGLRIFEVKSLMPQEVEKNQIRILEGKGLKERIVPKPKGWNDGMTKLLPIKKSIRSLQRNFKTACKKSGLNPLYTFHSLRHGFATRLLENGTAINQVSYFLGHENVATTSIYIKANPIDALKSYEDNF